MNTPQLKQQFDDEDDEDLPSADNTPDVILDDKSNDTSDDIGEKLSITIFRLHRKMIQEFKQKYRESIVVHNKAARIKQEQQTPVFTATTTTAGSDINNENKPEMLSTILSNENLIWRREASIRRLNRLEDQDFDVLKRKLSSSSDSSGSSLSLLFFDSIDIDPQNEESFLLRLNSDDSSGSSFFDCISEEKEEEEEEEAGLEEVQQQQQQQQSVIHDDKEAKLEKEEETEELQHREQEAVMQEHNEGFNDVIVNVDDHDLSQASLDSYEQFLLGLSSEVVNDHDDNDNQQIPPEMVNEATYYDYDDNYGNDNYTEPTSDELPARDYAQQESSSEFIVDDKDERQIHGEDNVPYPAAEEEIDIEPIPLDHDLPYPTEDEDFEPIPLDQAGIPRPEENEDIEPIPFDHADENDGAYPMEEEEEEDVEPLPLDQASSTAGKTSSSSNEEEQKKIDDILDNLFDTIDTLDDDISFSRPTGSLTPEQVEIRATTNEGDDIISPVDSESVHDESTTTSTSSHKCEDGADHQEQKDEDTALQQKENVEDILDDFLLAMGSMDENDFGNANEPDESKSFELSIANASSSSSSSNCHASRDSSNKISDDEEIEEGSNSVSTSSGEPMAESSSNSSSSSSHDNESNISDDSSTANDKVSESSPNEIVQSDNGEGEFASTSIADNDQPESTDASDSERSARQYNQSIKPALYPLSTEMAEKDPLDDILDGFLGIMDELDYDDAQIQASAASVLQKLRKSDSSNENSDTAETVKEEEAQLEHDKTDYSVVEIGSPKKNEQKPKLPEGHAESSAFSVPRFPNSMMTTQIFEFPSQVLNQQEKSPGISAVHTQLELGGEKSAFLSSLKALDTDDSPCSRVQDIINDQISGIQSESTKTFTPLEESRSRIQSPDLNVSASFLEEDHTLSEVFRLTEASESDRPHDPVATSLSHDAQSPELTNGKPSSTPESDRPHDPVATALSHDAQSPELIDVIDVKPTSISYMTSQQESESQSEAVSEEDERNEMDTISVTEENKSAQAAPLSPPRANRKSTIPDLETDTDDLNTSNHSLPSFQQNSFSTMSHSPVHSMKEKNDPDDTSEVSELMVPALSNDDDELNDNATDDTIQEAKQEHSSPRLTTPSRSIPSSKLPDSTVSKQSSASKAATRTPVRFDSNIPFTRTNERLDRHKHHNHHSPSTPHIVPTSRSPLRVRLEQASTTLSMFSSPDRSVTLQSLRGYYSLASPPRTPASPPPRIISQTPGDDKSYRGDYSTMAAPAASPYLKPPVRVCANKFVFNLHPRMGPCDRCWALASPEEQDRYCVRGSHLRIVRTRGGCDRSCTIFSPKDDEIPVRLCRQCFFITHQRDGSRIQVYRGNHIKVKMAS
jgi:hypothetical protein